MHPRTEGADAVREPSPALTLLLWIVAIAILTQAILAGLFISSPAPVLPFPVSTAIHVPFGVALFAASIVLALASARSRQA